MHVTACLAGQEEVDVEVGEDCRTLQALKEAVVRALPQLCVEGFDVSVGGRALDDDEGVVSLVDSVCLDVVPNTRGLSVLALREAGREVSEDGLLQAARRGDVSLVTLYLDAGVPLDCVDAGHSTPLHLSCRHALPLGNEHLSVATLLLDRGSRAIDQMDGCGYTPLHLACNNEHLKLATLLLDRGSRAIDEKVAHGYTPLHIACCPGHLFMSYGVSTRKRTRWRTPAWTGRQRTRRTSTFDRCRRTRHPANGWGTAVNSPWKVYHLRRSVRAA